MILDELWFALLAMVEMVAMAEMLIMCGDGAGGGSGGMLILREAKGGSPSIKVGLESAIRRMLRYVGP